jgi:hypothetical protein
MLMKPYAGKAFQTQEPCWRCGTCLWRLEPPVDGTWRYYCSACQHLTVRRAEAERALRDKPPDAVGVVVAVPFPAVLRPTHVHTTTGHDPQRPNVCCVRLITAMTRARPSGR